MNEIPNPIRSRMVEEGMHGRTMKLSIGNAIMIVVIFHTKNMLGMSRERSVLTV